VVQAVQGGKTSLENDERNGWPTTVVTNENEARVRVLLNQDRHISLKMLAAELKISKDSMAMILKEKMHRRKVCLRFVPHFLTPEQKVSSSVTIDERKFGCASQVSTTIDATLLLLWR
jgi:hypothetical protein